MTAFKSLIVGVGGYLPERVVGNAELATYVDTSDDWIIERTGIHARHVAAPHQNTSDLAIEAAKQALADAGVEAGQIGLIILATGTPDLTFPASAVRVQTALGVPPGPAFDVSAVCSGFVYALTTADALMGRGLAAYALVIGAETFSRALNWQDRATCVLFGDGAGAVVLKRVPANEAEGRGVLGAALMADGSHEALLCMDGGPSSTGSTGRLVMHGQAVFRHAVEKLSGAVRAAAEAADINISDIDWFVPHQANLRIIEGVGKKLGIPAERVVTTIAQHGNTSAASIPLALNAAVRDGRIRAGNLVVIEAMGSGFTWGAAAFRM